MISKRAALAFALVSLIAGVLLSLALRPPGVGTRVVVTGSEDGAPVRIRWRVPLSSPQSLPGSGETPTWLAAALEGSSAGAVSLDLYDPGEIVPAFAVTDAVRERKVQAGFTWLGYDQGKIPSSALFGATPFGLDPWAYIGWWFFADGKTLAEGIYARHNIKPVFCGISGPETAGWFATPLTSTDDLKGLKIRFAGLGGKVMQRVGASVTMLPSGEIFQALDTGVIDATEFSQPITDKALGFHRIAKYNYYPGWHQPFSATHFVVNLAVWEGRSRRCGQGTLIETVPAWVRWRAASVFRNSCRDRWSPSSRRSACRPSTCRRNSCGSLQKAAQPRCSTRKPTSRCVLQGGARLPARTTRRYIANGAGWPTCPRISRRLRGRMAYGRGSGIVPCEVAIS